MISIDKKKYVLLILLDLSTSFDMVSTPSCCLTVQRDWEDVVLDWFKSYLQHRLQSVLIDRAESDLAWATTGVGFQAL